MRVYIASFFETRQRLLEVRDRLNAAGYEVTSTWLDEGKKPDDLSRFDWWSGLATKDLQDINRSDLLILDTLDVNPRGGREVEWGYAVGSNLAIAIVGPMRNVFHTLASHQFKNWEDAIAFMTLALTAEDLTPEMEKLIIQEPWIADPVRDAENEKQQKENKLESNQVKESA